MGVFAFENPNMTELFPSDTTPGNGRAPVWLYAYAANNGTEHRAFQVSADGQVATLNETMSDAPDVGESIGAWAIDSDAAVATARANATFEAVASSEGAAFMEALGSEDGTTVWAIMAGSASRQAIALINAVDGSLIFVESFAMEFNMPAMPVWGAPGANGWTGPQVEIHETGSVDATTRTVEYPFTVEYADVATLRLSYDKTLPLEAIGWHILDSTGEEIDGAIVRDGSMGGSTTAELTIEAPGDYTLVIMYHNMASMVPVPVGGIDYMVDFYVGPMPEIDIEMPTCC